MVVEIDNKTTQLKYTFRAYIIYEEITGNSFIPSGYKELVTLFYSVYMASNKESLITFDAFIDWLDDNPHQLTEFGKWLTENIEKNKSLTGDKETADQTTVEDLKKN